jgi:hypothetical protein
MNDTFRQGSASPTYGHLNIKWETKNMIRYTLFVLTILGSAATAIASIAPVDHSNPNNVTVVSKNDIYPQINGVIDGVIVEKCAVENCSDTPNNS